MQGSNSIIKTPKAQRVRNEQFEVKLDRRDNERNRQAVRAVERNRKVQGE